MPPYVEVSAVLFVRQGPDPSFGEKSARAEYTYARPSIQSKGRLLPGDGAAKDPVADPSPTTDGVPDVFAVNGEWLAKPAPPRRNERLH